MGLFKQKQENGKIKIRMLHFDGLPNTSKVITYLTLDEIENKIIINPKYSTGPAEFKLDIDKIKDTSKYTDTEMVAGKKGKRALVGGIIAGPAGAIVGAVSAKDKKKYTFYRFITYISNGEDKDIIFNSAGDFNEDMFFNKLQSIISPELSSDSIEL